MFAPRVHNGMPGATTYTNDHRPKSFPLTRSRVGIINNLLVKPWDFDRDQETLNGVRPRRIDSRYWDPFWKDRRSFDVLSRVYYMFTGDWRRSQQLASYDSYYWNDDTQPKIRTFMAGRLWRGFWEGTLAGTYSVYHNILERITRINAYNAYLEETILDRLARFFPTEAFRNRMRGLFPRVLSNFNMNQILRSPANPRMRRGR